MLCLLHCVLPFWPFVFESLSLLLVEQVVFEAQMDVEVVSFSLDNDQQPDEAFGFPDNLNIYCIDDSASARRLLQYNLTIWANTTNVYTFGDNETEVAKFTAAALEHADIVILDQHLEYRDAPSILGTDIAAKLVGANFQGMICIRSANMAEHDENKYLTAGAHCMFGKDVPMKQMIKELRQAYMTRFQQGSSLNAC